MSLNADVGDRTSKPPNHTAPLLDITGTHCCVLRHLLCVVISESNQSDAANVTKHDEQSN